MTEARKKILDSIGFDWDFRNKGSRIQQFQELQQYKAKEGEKHRRQTTFFV